MNSQAGTFMYAADIEKMPRDQLRKLQLERLKTQVGRTYYNTEYYRKRMDQAGVKPDDIKTLDDIRKLPMTSKEDLRENFPFGMFAVPRTDVVRLHVSSGTTGTPTVVGYTMADLNVWTELVARSIACVGVRPGDVFHNATALGMFTGGMGFHYGAERLGCTVVPMSAGNTTKQLALMRDFGAEVLCCTPSYALRLTEVAEETGINIQDKLRVGLFGAEAWSNEMRSNLEQRLGITTGDFWGLSEMTGPGVSVDCNEKNGLHVWEDCFLIEVLDPVTLEPVGPGETGEIVISTLVKQAQPILRFRCRDLTRLIEEPCPCGRTHVRIERVFGRSDDMLTIRGVNLFPSQIESVLVNTKGIEHHYELVVEQSGAMAELTVNVEAAKTTDIAQYAQLSATVGQIIKSTIGVTSIVKVLAPGSLPRWEEGKAVRVRDLRKSLKVS